MGLDNGIFITNIKKEEIPPFVEYEESTWHTGYEESDIKYCIDIAYWRKCWGIRNEIVRRLHIGDNETYKLDSEDITVIIRILKKFMSKESWDDNEASTIWEFEQQFDNMLSILVNLKWLESYKKSNPMIECWFYDSF